MRTLVATSCSIALAALFVLLTPSFAPVASTTQKPGAKPAAKAPLKAPPPPPPLVPFLGKMADARRSAKERNVPILVHVILDQNDASDDYTKRILPDADVLRASVGAVVIVANNGTHPTRAIDVVVDGVKQKRDMCSVFPMFATCAQHQTCWSELFAELHDEQGEMRCPQVAIYSPDGKLATRMDSGDVPAPAELIAALTEVATQAGPGLTDAQLSDVKKKLEVGRAAMTAKTWPEAWTAFAAVLAITQKSVYADEARGEQPKALAGMKAELERIGAQLVPGTAVKAYQELVAFAKATVGTPIEADVTARLKKADADKAIQPELAAWKLSVEADALLAEARDLYEKKEASKGEKIVRKLLGKRYAGTAAAETARKLWPDITTAER